MSAIRFEKDVRGVAHTARRSTSGVALLTTPRTTPPPCQMAATTCHRLPNDCHLLSPSAMTCQALPHRQVKIWPTGAEAFARRRTVRPSISLARHWFGQTLGPRPSWIRSRRTDETRENRSRGLAGPVTVCHIVQAPAVASRFLAGRERWGRNFDMAVPVAHLHSLRDGGQTVTLQFEPEGPS